jgi:hypothetical protein
MERPVRERVVELDYENRQQDPDICGGVMRLVLEPLDLISTQAFWKDEGEQDFVNVEEEVPGPRAGYAAPGYDRTAEGSFGCLALSTEFCVARTSRATTTVEFHRHETNKVIKK